VINVIRPVIVRVIAIVVNKSAKIQKNPHKNEWIVYSEKGKRLGSYDSLSGAKKRLKQIEFFKHLKNDNLIEPEFYGEPPDFLDVEVKQASKRFEMIIKIFNAVK